MTTFRPTAHSILLLSLNNGDFPRRSMAASNVYLEYLQLLTRGECFLNRFLRTMRGEIWRCRE